MVKLTLLTAAATALATASVAFAQGGSIDNNAVANAIFNQAVTLTNGDYYITNVGNGKSLYFTRTDKTNVYPQSGRKPITLERYGAIPGTMILSGLKKCVSAQWGFQHLRGAKSSADNAAVSYACAIGSTRVPSTVEKPKQAWVFVPATGCGGADRLAKRAHHFGKRTGPAVEDELVEKRAPSGGCFQIITSDHIRDMATKAITGSSMNTPGGYVSAALDFWDTDAADQKWIVTPA